MSPFSATCWAGRLASPITCATFSATRRARTTMTIRATVMTITRTNPAKWQKSSSGGMPNAHYDTPCCEKCRSTHDDKKRWLAPS